MEITQIISFITIPIFVFGQLPEKQDFFEAYYSGAKFHEAIEKSDYMVLSKFDIDSLDLANLIQELKEIDTTNSRKIIKDILYNDYTDKFEFFVYHGKYINDGTKWGLMDYSFIYKCIIDINAEGDKYHKIIEAKILKSDSEQKLWWQSYMRSYTDKIYNRNEIADKYGIIPPPPPPPKTKEWMKE